MIGVQFTAAAAAVFITAAPAAAQADFPAQLTARLKNAIAQAAGSAFAKIDANRDGMISPAEASAFGRQLGGRAGVVDGASWQMADRNRDGVITRAEFMSVAMNQQAPF
ncbi:EF-hand domain-containing protein [Sphingosinicella sp. BN140058]|uniref:EF-hand domain-containing protein n=1 Tax=Sphingosinicella sp. BN140058 TaxID=1892855 RepID=UPI001012F280|nr:EF-hand domain-containing protein [Sphingosinicella sp. BN140058]QAY80380.1 hypothetical protein ETR14_27455 [Sphingosinicella sp. BN140058]